MQTVVGYQKKIIKKGSKAAGRYKVYSCQSFHKRRIWVK